MTLPDDVEFNWKGCEHDGLTDSGRAVYVVAELMEKISAIRAENEKLRAENAELKVNPPQALLDKWLLNELKDLAMLYDHITRTYNHFTDGRISKPNTEPEEVFRVAADLETERRDDELESLRAENAELKRRIENMEGLASAELQAQIDRDAAENAEFIALRAENAELHKQVVEFMHIASANYEKAQDSICVRLEAENKTLRAFVQRVADLKLTRLNDGEVSTLISLVIDEANELLKGGQRE